ncbi:MAG: hypothetical protein ABI473_13175 [Candidatus Dormibacter sp.]
MLRRDRRAAERGQTLIFALAFLAFFGLVAASVLAFGSVVESQRVSTERTAGRDSVAEGSAQFALGDTRGQACGISNGTLQFPSTIQADKLTYGSVDCQHSSGGGIAPGSACVLCLLNSSPPNAGRNVLTADGGLTVNGEVDANGSISGGVTSTGPGARVGLLTGARCDSCSPTATTLRTPFNDPLAGALPIPTDNQPARTCNACGVISPGVFSNITVTNGTVWMKTGVYIVDGQLKVGGGDGLLTNADASSASTTDSDSGGSKDSGSGGSIDANSGPTVTYTQRGRRSQGTLVDTSKVWRTNQWAGAVVTVDVSNNTPETAIVAGNTADTLTMTSRWTPTPSPGDAYVVSTIGYTANTLVDTSKEWATDQWAGSVVQVTLSNNTTETNIVSNNTDNTLSMNSAWGTTPSAGDAYVVSTIGYTSNTLVDTSKNWGGDQWAGSMVQVTLSDGSTETNTVAGNTDDTLTMSAKWGRTPSPGNAYIVSTIGYTATTLVDTSKTWVTNQWAGAAVTVTLPNGGKLPPHSITGNTAHTLTVSPGWGSLPPPGSAYSIVAPVVIYLACPTSGPYWSCATAGQSGGHMSVAGQGRFDLSAPTAPADPYAGISLFADPNLVDPGRSTLNLSGNGGRFVGTVYLPRGSVDVSAGGGNGVTVTGRLIVQSLSISGDEGDADSLGLSLPGTGPLGPLAACEYYNDSLAGTEANGTRQPARVQFETGCDSAGLSAQGGTTPTSIINFAYGP